MGIYWKITITLAAISFLMLILPLFFNILDDRYTVEVDRFLGKTPRNYWYTVLGGIIVLLTLISAIVSVFLEVWY